MPTFYELGSAEFHEVMERNNEERDREFHGIIQLWPSAPLKDLETMLERIKAHADKWNGLNFTEIAYKQFVQERIDFIEVRHKEAVATMYKSIR